MLVFNEESFGAVTGYSYRFFQLDEHVCYRYVSTLKYRSAPHKLSKTTCLNAKQAPRTKWTLVRKEEAKRRRKQQRARKASRCFIQHVLL